MKSLLEMLNKSIVREYYRQNMVFLFVVILFCFGFLRAIEHITIIKLILKLPALLLLTFLVWAAYGFKTILFTLRLLESTPYEFLYQARLFSRSKRIMAFTVLFFNLLLLILVYAVFMIKIGMDEKRYLEVAAILVFNVMLMVAGALMLEFRLKRPNPEKIIKNTFQGIFSKYSTPAYLFFVRYLMAHQPVLLLITKVFSLAALSGFCLLYPTDDYDERLLSLAGLLIGASHIVFSQHFFRFEHLHLSLTRNLPIPIPKRYLAYALTYGCLLLPEALVLLKNLPDGVSHLYAVQWLVFVVSMVLFNHHLFYINDISPDTFMKMLFFGGVILLVLIMFKVPVILVSLVFLATSFTIFRKYFYISEYREE